MIKAVIYDLDDTLYDFHRGNALAMDRLCQEARKRFGIPAEEYRKVYTDSYREICGQMKEEIQSLNPEEVDLGMAHDRMLRIACTQEKYHLPLFPHVLELYDIYWETLLADMEPEENIAIAMSELKSRGIRIGIGTNMTARIQYRKLQMLGLGQYLDFVVVSEETIFDKPDLRFFAKVREKAGCEAGECLFVGDNYTLDYLGAKHAGMHALWYARKEKPWNRVSDAEREDVRRAGELLLDHSEILTAAGLGD